MDVAQISGNMKRCIYAETTASKAASACWGFFLMAALAAPAMVAQAAEPLARSTVYVSGREGYHTFRIPALLTAADGTLLAFAEGRKHSSSDAGDIDVVLKRSTDMGKTWGPLQIVWDDGQNTCGNPCPVLDRQQGTIFLLLTWNRGEDREPQIIAQTSHDTRRVFVSESRDGGISWSAPREITPDVKRTNWTWYATGPGAGIQIQRGPHRGRLVVPCDHIEAGTKRYYSHIIFSDDHGKSWQLGGSSPSDKVNECEVVELADGRLMLNMRNYDTSSRTRQVAFSSDGGMTWSDQRHDAALYDPICQASIRRLSWPENGGRNIILFSNPAGPKRERMTVRASLDDCRSWQVSRQISDAPAAYSCLEALSDGTIGLLYETGVKSPYETVVFLRFSFDWLQEK